MSVSRTDEVPVATRVTCPANVVEIGEGAGPAGGALVVWNDNRRYGVHAIMAARIDASGALLDPTGGLVSSTEFETQYRPAAAFDGANYWVAWSDDMGVRAARISGSGTLIDAVPINLDTLGGYNVALAAGAGEALVVWGGPSDDRIFGARIGTDGTLLDSTPLLLASGTAVFPGPVEIFDGTNFVVAWQESGVHALRVSPAGSIVAPGVVDLAPTTFQNAFRPAITFNGSEYLVAWSDGAMKHMRVSTSMTPIDSPTSYGSPQGEPALAYDGTGYMLATEEQPPTSAVVDLLRVSATNQYIGDSQFDAAGNIGFGNSTLLFDGTDFLVGYASDYVATGRRVAKDGSILSGPVIWSQTKNDQEAPDIAFDGTSGYTVAWTDTRDPKRRSSAYAARLSPTGGLDGDGILVMPGSGNALIARPRDADSTSLVVWAEGHPSMIRAARIGPAGDLIDPAGLLIQSNVEVNDQFPPLAVACMSTTCLVAWIDDSFRLEAARIGLDGTVLDTSPLALGASSLPTITAYDGGFLLAGDIAAFIVPAQGAPKPISLPGSGVRTWDISWDGSSFLMVWSVQVTNDSFDLFGVRLDADGAKIEDEFRIGAIPQYSPVHVVRDGMQWIVVWWEQLFTTTPTTLSGVRVTADGRVRDPVPVPVADVIGKAVVADGSDGSFALIREYGTLLPPERGIALGASWIRIEGDTPGTETSDSGCGCQAREPTSQLPAVFLACVYLIRRHRRRRGKVPA